MNDSLKEFIDAIVGESAVNVLSDYLDGFEKKVDTHAPGLDMAKVLDHGNIIILRFETFDDGMALVNKNGRHAIDLDTRDKNSGLIAISEEQFNTLLNRGLRIEEKYARENVTSVVNIDDVRKGGVHPATATAEQEDAMLDVCTKIIETLDGKENHYPNLAHRTYGHVTVIENGDDYLATITCSGSNICGGTEPDEPCAYSKAVSDAMKTVFVAIREKLPNKLPAHMRLILPLVNERFNALSEQERSEIIENIRKKKKR